MAEPPSLTPSIICGLIQLFEMVECFGSNTSLSSTPIIYDTAIVFIADIIIKDCDEGGRLVASRNVQVLRACMRGGTERSDVVVICDVLCLFFLNLT